MTVMARSTPERGTTGPEDGTGRLLLGAVAFFAAAVLVHGADHARRGADSISGDVFWLGTAALVLEVGVVVLGCQRHRLAPLAAATAGFSLTAGYIGVHFLPARSWLSDSFTSGTGVSALSWGAASLEVIAALTLGLAGWIALRRRGGLASASLTRSDQLTLGHALRHPVALAMVTGNLAILGVSFSQL